MNFEENYNKAKEIATDKHKAQSYGEGSPYTVHLALVELALRRFGVTPATDQGKNLIIGSWLHDVIEDTDATYEFILELFGKDIADLVATVTDEPGVNRKERHFKTYPKIAAHPYAVILKLADRIVNVESCLKNNDSRINMYRKEMKEFQRQLEKKDQATEMWDHLKLLLN
jgi:(p)ppGpp synthase/HD superfamily hydrolase